MIKELNSVEEYRNFYHALCTDPSFSQPNTKEDKVDERFKKALEKDDRRVVATFENGEITGIFDLLTLFDDDYIEVLEAYSRERNSYEELFEYLGQNFKGYRVDFIINPQNIAAKEALAAKGARFDDEQQKMVLKNPTPRVDMSGTRILSEEYVKDYLSIHTVTGYWTGERVIEDKDGFAPIIALCDGKVVGYLDLSTDCEINEPYDVLVLEEYRRRGFGKKLLARAIEINKPKGMVLSVVVDNIPALRLYESMGFEKEEGQNSVFASITV